MKILITTILLLLYVQVMSQVTVESILASVERNNTTLLACQKIRDAEKTGNKTGLLPANPVVEFNYLWGKPSAIGNRADFSIRQSFDFPTAYKYRSQIAGLKNEQAALEYQKQRMEILHQTRLVCTELTYWVALRVEYAGRVHDARELADAFQKKLSTGEAGILEYNKAQMYWLGLTKELENIDIERNTLQAKLRQLNGGNSVSFTDSVFTTPALLPDFEQWYAQAEQNNPVLQWLKQELALTQKQEQLQEAQSLPEFFAGYMSEKVVGQQYQGFMLGITLPLWENKNMVKYARAKSLANESLQTDARLQFFLEMKNQHAKTVSLQRSAESYRNGLVQFSNHELLYKAFNKGEISLSEYYIELSNYYESIDKLLDMERIRSLAYIDLLKYM